MNNLTFKQLEAIREVARNGTVVKAAAALHVPLSTLNQKIKRLDIKIPKKSE